MSGPSALAQQNSRVSRSRNHLVLNGATSQIAGCKSGVRLISSATVTDSDARKPGGEISTKSGTLIPSPMPPFLTDYPDILGRIQALNVLGSQNEGRPNHVIINEYAPGQGIMPHEDGPAYHPVVATVSLGSHTVMHYYRYSAPEAALTETVSHGPSESTEAAERLDSLEHSVNRSKEGRTIDPKPVLSLLLEPRSLVMTSEELYASHLHGIEPVTHDNLDAHTPSSAGTLRGGIRVANFRLLGAINDDEEQEELKKVIEEGGRLERGTRVSLTCRVVDKVAKLGVGVRK